VITSLDPATTRADALTVLARIFHASGIDEPEREARLALLHACTLKPTDLILDPGAPLGPAVKTLRDVARRRAAREPLSRISGSREFWGLRLVLSPAALDPRPDTETLIEAALAIFGARKSEPLRILDLGVGSGAILCALLTEFPSASGTGVDLSPEAAETAARNLDRCGFSARVKILVGNWTSVLAPCHDISGRFDLIVSNPPYIPSADIATLPPEVRLYDPRQALDGGPDGLDAYRAILPAAAALLLPGGAALMEVGAGQAGDVLALARSAGLGGVATRRDLAGIERVVLARRPSTAEWKEEADERRLLAV